MPPRRALTELTNGQKRGKELNKYQRGKIEAHHEHRLSNGGIGKLIGKGRDTVAKSILRNPGRNAGISKPRSSAPLKTTARDRRRILFAVKRDPRISYAKIRSQNGLTVSNSTIYRIL